MQGVRSTATDLDLQIAWETKEPLTAIAILIEMCPGTLRARWVKMYGEDAVAERKRRMIPDVSVPCSICGALITLKSNQAGPLIHENFKCPTCTGDFGDRACPVCAQRVSGTKGLGAHFWHQRKAGDKEHPAYLQKEAETQMENEKALRIQVEPTRGLWLRGYSVQAIADELGVSYGKINRYLRDNNLRSPEHQTIRNQLNQSGAKMLQEAISQSAPVPVKAEVCADSFCIGAAQEKHFKRDSTLTNPANWPTAETLFTLYHDEGLSDIQIGLQLGVSRRTVVRMRDYLGVASKRKTRAANLPQTLTEYQEQVLIGTMMGDGYLMSRRKDGGNASLHLSHCREQEEYLLHKMQIFGPLYCHHWQYTETHEDKETHERKEYPMSGAYTHDAAVFAPYHRLFYCGDKGEKSFKNLPGKVGKTALAYWFMDDGLIEGTGFCIVAHWRLRTDTLRVLSALRDEFGIKFSFREAYESDAIDRIRICEESGDWFVRECLQPNMPPCMAYKVHPRYNFQSTTPVILDHY